MTDRLAGLHAVVTGAGSGIGLATVEAMVREGARVAAIDLRPPAPSDSVLPLVGDVTDQGSLDAAADAARAAFGGIDIMIGNAGIGAVGAVEDNDDDEWHRVFDVNVVGIVRTARAFLPLVRQSERGAVVLTASIVSHVGLPQRACYGASKGAVLALTLAMASDLAAAGVRVNCVCPGTVDTPWVGRLLDQADDPAAARANLVARQPMRVARRGVCHGHGHGDRRWDVRFPRALCMSSGGSIDGYDPGEPAPLGSSSVAVTRLGLGCAPLGNLYETVSEGESVATVDAALAEGVRFFDTAPLYGFGLSEQRLGRAVNGAEIDRRALVLATKVGRVLVTGGIGATIFKDAPAFRPVFDYSERGVLQSVEDSLTRLGIDRVDVLHVHDPDDHIEDALRSAFPALRRLRDEGVITAVGAGMNQSAALTRFVREAGVDCVLIAGRYSLLDQSAATDLLPEALAAGVAVIVGGVFNSGVLANPTAGHYDYAVPPADIVDRARRLGECCRRYEVPLTAAALQFPFGHPAVASVVVGARSADEVRRNAADLRRPIPSELWDDLAREGLLIT